MPRYANAHIFAFACLVALAIYFFRHAIFGYLGLQHRLPAQPCALPLPSDDVQPA